jgi:hypothetical protein
MPKRENRLFSTVHAEKLTATLSFWNVKEERKINKLK